MAFQYLSPKSNFIFKQIFGDQRNADILGGFLQAVLDLPAEEYDHLTIVDPHLMPGRESEKLSILDVRLHTKSGNAIDVEIQVDEPSKPARAHRILLGADGCRADWRRRKVQRAQAIGVHTDR